MPIYQAPLRDMHFVMHELGEIDNLLKTLPPYQHLDAALMDAIVEEAAKFVTNELFPLNQSGDQEGCHFVDGKVTTPKGFKEAYQHFVAGGWMSLNAYPQYGGQGLPKMLQVALDEMLCSTNEAFSLYTVLTQGAVHALSAFADEKLKNTYLPKND